MKIFLLFFLFLSNFYMISTSAQALETIYGKAYATDKNVHIRHHKPENAASLVAREKLESLLNLSLDAATRQTLSDRLQELSITSQ